MLEVTDEEIAYAESVLLPVGCQFDDERRAFLKRATSCDVVACPGSGKTTALMAKLLILARKMPLEKGRGICVLTHTNVAIDEIKKQAGSGSSVLFSHPNFFGTIQTFVNRFLARPCFKTLMKKQIQAIDNASFYRALGRIYSPKSPLGYWLEPRGGISVLGSYWFKTDLSVGNDLDRDIHKLSRDTKSYEQIEQLRMKVLSDGILSYNDAYSLGLAWLEKDKEICNAVRHRFQYIFVDEMQDTDSHQLRVLDLLFKDAGCVICRLGDPNQAIYQGSVKAELCWTPDEDALHFSNSMRYGRHISKVLETVRVDRRIALSPSETRDSLHPHLIVYKKGEEQQILSKFAGIIFDNRLHEIEKATFRAVGWVGKDDGNEGKTTIGSYFPDYLKVSRNKSRRGESLLSYAQHALACLAESPGDCSSAVATLWDSLVSTLRLGKNTDVSAGGQITLATLKRFLKENPEVNRQLRKEFSELVLKMGESVSDATELRSCLSDLYRSCFELKDSVELKLFLESDTLKEVSPSGPPTNEFVSENGIIVKVSTVHSVKGETHTATLYLETKYQKSVDSKRLIPFCAGKYSEKDAAKAHHIENLKVAHVAFSRPTHLLAFACCEDNVSGIEDSLREAGWTICRVVEDD